MTFSSIKRRIAKLEENTNIIDYPDDLMNRKPWTFKYLDELYECSVNGARSPKAIAYLKKVTNTLYASVAVIGLIFVAIVAVVSIILAQK